MQIEEQVPLSRHTTFQIGGPARFFARVRDIQELKESLDFARDQKLAVLILGGGSNVLVDDAGFDGLVIKIELRGTAEEKMEDEVLMIAAAGEPWDELVETAVNKNLWGLENLSGIPGTVGGAPVQNIGAYGAELADTLQWVEVLDIGDGMLKKFQKNECNFSYRTSRFKKEPTRYVITRVALALRAKGEPNIKYRELSERFLGAPPLSPRAIRAAVLDIRSKKFPDLAREGTAGSFFLNPVVSPAVARRLCRRYPALPQFVVENGIKIPLAWLLDHALNLRGARHGGARLFERQPLVIVAEKNCSARDVRALAEKIKNLLAELGIKIEEEVKIV